MGGKAKGKQRQDKFYHLAKEQGYRSRASFKLLQLDAKYRFLPSSRSILDLCAAPGGWLQVAVRHAPVKSFILGVDLIPIRPIRGAYTIIQDITTSKCRHEIRDIMDVKGCRAFDCVLHDGAPDVGASWSMDATTQSGLVVHSIRLATSFLTPKGTFVTKVFRSQDYSAIIYCLKQLFDEVEATKPVASRNSSAEIYVIGLKYKAPAKIHPNLLNIEHLFNRRADSHKVVDVLRGTKQKRNREGYEDGVTVLWKTVPASEFIWSDNPAVFLGSVDQLSFDYPESLPIKEHELTTEEIKSYCKDLNLLDTHRFKGLIKWRVKVRNTLASTKAVASDATANAKDDGVSGDNFELDEDQKLLNEMEELTNVHERKKKREKKLLAKRRYKDKIRNATGMQIDASQDSYHDQALFSLATIKGKKDLDVIDFTEISEENDGIEVSDSEEGAYAVEPRSDISSGMDSAEEQKQYDEQLEEMIDRAYEQYISKRRSVTNQRKRVKLAHPKGQAELFEGDDGEEIIANGDMNRNQKIKEKNPLMHPMFEEEEPSQEQIMEQWFSQDVFAEAVQTGTLLEKSKHEEAKEKEEEVKRVNKSSKKTSKQNIPTSKNPTSKDEDFEIVPSEPIKGAKDSSSSDEDEEDMDVDTKAEILAYAKKTLRKKQRAEILDDAYNKYVFDDDEERLPTWFVEEENRHNKPMKPITKEEVEAMKARFREINARPAKKVAQAKARKKRVAMKQLEKVRQKSNAIADQTDISEKSKKKMIDRLYKRATPKRPKKELVVAKKGVRVRTGKGKKLVDRRMKKDTRRIRGSGKPGKKGKAAKGKCKGSGPKKAGKMNHSDLEHHL